MQWNEKEDTFTLKRNELANLLDVLTFPTIFKKLDRSTKDFINKIDKKMAKYLK